MLQASDNPGYTPLVNPKHYRSRKAFSMFTEFLMTLMFVYVGCGSCISSYLTEKTDNQKINDVDTARMLVIGMAHGLAIVVLLFASLHISGGHLNPAVTLAMIVTGNIRLGKGVGYIGAQFLGGICGAAFLRFTFGEGAAQNMGVHDIGNGVGIFGGIVLEFIITFILVYVIFSVGVNRKGPSALAAFAIGFTVLMNHLVAVPFTGASMNPARTLGPAVVTGSYDHLYIYFIGPPLGAVAAACFYQYGYLHVFENDNQEYFPVK